ncbi:damage-inducible protein CinA, partial [Neisseria meningitidis]|nr:damage-inducible protein CinA [Neisseria meningitidis]
RFDGNRESVRAQAVAFALERLAVLIENGGDAV